jgi:hypothetical protein
MKHLNSIKNLVAAALLAVTGNVAVAQGDCTVKFDVNSGCIDGTSGWASVTNITGGTTPWVIQWSTGDNVQFVSGLASGTYTVTVTDAMLCAVTAEVTIDCKKDEDNCHFRTQTQGGWGTACSGGNPGCYRDANFAAAFPNGLTIGCTNQVRLTTSAAVDAFLPSSTTARALNAGTLTNPGQTYKNVLAGQLVALTLSVGFDAYDLNFGGSGTWLGDAEITTGMFQGWTVQMLLDEANSFIGGCGSNFTAAQLNSALTMVNENYVDGTTDNGNVTCTKKTEKSLGISGRMQVYPNPASDVFTLDMVADQSGDATVTMLDATGRVVLGAQRLGLAKGEQRYMTINASALNNGTYFLLVEQNGTTTTQRVMVAH